MEAAARSPDLVWILKSKENNIKDSLIIHKAIEKKLGSLSEHIGNVRMVDHEDLTLRIDNANGLLIYEGDVVINPPKFVIVRIGSGILKPEFHLPLLMHLEYMGVSVLNSSSACNLATHKFLHLQELVRHNIPIATTFTCASKDLSDVNTKLIDHELGYPQIMKSIHGNQGSKVVLLPSPNLVSEMKHVLTHTVPYLFQDYVKESHGRDIRVIVVDNKVSFSMIRTSNTTSVKANLSAGGTAEVITGKYPDAEALALKIAKVLNMDIVGVDLLFSDSTGFVCCEVNNCPGISRPVYSGHGIEDDVAEMIFKRYYGNNYKCKSEDHATDTSSECSV